MKKFLKIFLLLFIFISCSSDDLGSSTSSDNVLLRKIITTNLGDKYTTKYQYNGKRLIKFESERGKGEFIYEGDKIINFKRYIRDASTPGSIFEQDISVDFFYDSQDRLVRFERYYGYSEPFLEYVCELTYDEESPDIVYFNNDYIPDYPDLATFKGYFRIENHQITERYTLFNSNYTLLFKYLYDDKNHPLKNVIGFENIALFGMFYETLHDDGFSTNNGVFNNCNKVIFYNYSDGVSEYAPHVYEYNSKGFPVSIDKGNKDVADELFYN